MPVGEGRFREEDPPERLPDDEVTLIDIYGSVFYADTEAIDAQLPEVGGTRHAVLVVRLRGRGELGSSGIGLLRHWAEQFQAGAERCCWPASAEDGRPTRAHRHRGRCSALKHLPGAQPRLPAPRRKHIAAGDCG